MSGLYRNGFIRTIGLAVLAALLLFIGLRRCNQTSSTTGVTDTNTAVNAGPSTTINGRTISLSYDPAQRYILQSEYEQANIPRIETPVPTASPVQPLAVGSPTPQPTATPAPVPTPTTAQVLTNGVSFIDYYVQPGQTVYGLVNNSGYNTSEALLAQYGITPSTLLANTTIRLPVYGGTVAPGSQQNVNCASGRSHIVVQGQNLFRIALSYGTTYQNLASINGIADPHWISVGQVICLP